MEISCINEINGRQTVQCIIRNPKKKFSFSRIKKKIAKAALMKILMKIPLRIAVLQIKDIAIN
jgi:hypothetical protein